MDASKTTSTINGLKANVSRGYGLAEHYESKSIVLENMLVKSCVSMLPHFAADLFWDFVSRYRTYGEIMSDRVGIKSMLGEIVIKGYTNKKGVVTPEKTVMAHYTQEGRFLGYVSKLGSEPIAYKMRIQITKKNFKFIHNKDAKLIGDFFKSNEKLDASEEELKDCSKKTLRAERRKDYDEECDEACRKSSEEVSEEESE
jgi:hypothetical protein